MKPLSTSASRPSPHRPRRGRAASIFVVVVLIGLVPELALAQRPDLEPRMDEAEALALLESLSQQLSDDDTRLRERKPEIFDTDLAYRTIAARLDLDPAELAQGRVGSLRLDPIVDAELALGNTAIDITQAVLGATAIFGLARNEIIERGAYQGYGYLLESERERLVGETEVFRQALAELEPLSTQLIELLVEAVPLALRVAQLRAADSPDAAALNEAEMALISHRTRLFEATSAIYRTTLEAPIPTPIEHRDPRDLVYVRF